MTPLFSIIVALRFVQGMLLGTFPALMVAYINEEFVPQRVGTLIGIYLGSTAAGGLLGRMSTTLISNFYSWRQDFLILAVWTLVIGILYCCFLPASKHIIAEPHLGSVKNTIFPLVYQQTFTTSLPAWISSSWELSQLFTPISLSPS
jgi:predicted MFS family arabinose efflux permease